MKEEPEKPYDINLGRFKNHRRVFPWMLVVKVILALALIWFIFYTIEEMAAKQQQQTTPVNPDEIQIEIP